MSSTRRQRSTLVPLRFRRRAGRTASPSHAEVPAVLILSGSVGAGHDGVAAELGTRLEAAGVHVTHRDYLDAVPHWTKRILRDGYTASVNHAPSLFEWLFHAIETRRWVWFAAKLVLSLANRRVETWANNGHRVVVATYPPASHTLGQLKAAGRISATLVTVLTDPAVHRLWVHSEIDRHLTITPATAAQGYELYGVMMESGGPLVPAKFGGDRDKRGMATRRELGLDIDQPVALLMAGSLGLGDVDTAVDAVLETGIALPLVVCGRNERLRRDLSARPGVVALGWRSDIPDLMAAADVLVHNAGGLSLTEALVAGLPAVSFACLPGHGRANAALLEAAGLVPWARTPAELRTALRDQLERVRVYAPPTPPGHDTTDVILRILQGSPPSADGAPVGQGATGRNHQCGEPPLPQPGNSASDPASRNQ